MEKLNSKRARVLWALTRYPGYKLKEISKILGIRLPTLSIIKKDLFEKSLVRRMIIPCVQRLGCEILGIVYADFNPMIPASKRSEITRGAIEIYDELFLSIGEAHFGFSLNFARDFTSMQRINEKRIEIFSNHGFLENKIPTQVIFSFPLSNIYRFFDCSKLINASFALEMTDDYETEHSNLSIFGNTGSIVLNEYEKAVLCEMVENPDANNKEIAETIGISPRYVHTIKEKLRVCNLYKEVLIPDFWNLGFDLLHIYHGKFNPTNTPDNAMIEEVFLRNPNIVFFIRSRYEYFSLGIYRNYEEYKNAETRVLKKMRKYNILSEICASYTFNYGTMVIMKDLNFAPILKNLLGCN